MAKEYFPTVRKKVRIDNEDIAFVSVTMTNDTEGIDDVTININGKVTTPQQATAFKAAMRTALDVKDAKQQASKSVFENIEAGIATYLKENE